MGRQKDPLGIVQKIEVWPYEQMVKAQPRICHGEWDAQTSLGFWDKNGSHNLGQTTKPCNNQQQKKGTCRIANFAVPDDHWVKLKENEKRDKYLDLARKLKKLWNMKVAIMPIVIGVLGTVAEGLLKGLEGLEMRGQVGTIQTTAVLRSAIILRWVLEPWGYLLSLKLLWENHRLTLVWKTLIGVIIIIIPARTPDLILINKKKGPYMEMKESEEINNKMDLTTELNKSFMNIRVMVIPIVVSKLGTVSKNLKKRHW